MSLVELNAPKTWRDNRPLRQDPANRAIMIPVHITHLSLTNYRNYSRLLLDLPAGPILFRGDNAHGKTNLLEAIAFLSTTRSLQARQDQQLINWLTLTEDVLPFTRVEATVKTARNEFALVITVVKEGESLRKVITLNGVKKRAMDVIGRLTSVLFLPQDIELVIGPPAVRRRYLDSTLCQISAPYCRALSQFNKVLTQRNALLKDLAKRNGPPDQLAYWDEQLAEHGAVITLERHQTLLTLDVTARQHHRAMSAGREGLRLCYLPSIDLYQQPAPDSQLPLTLEQLPPYNATIPTLTDLRQQYRTTLRQRQAEEIRRGVTTNGPHRDDFLFLVDGIDMGLYGSRGQQRTAALSVKLAEIELMRQVTQEMPILLLDDVMSELDIHRRQQILKLVEQAGQSLLTTTDWDDYEPAFRQRAALFSVTQGRIAAETP